MEAKGQYGKRNPLFMYQGTTGYSVKDAPQAEESGQKSEETNIVTSSQSGTARCGTL